MTTKRFFIILIALLAALTGFARATDNKTFERFYNLTPKEFIKQHNYYTQHNLFDSAMMCANVQASKYGREKLSLEEIDACCAAFRSMGIVYMQKQYNYQLAAENYLKAEQIAQKHNLISIRITILNDEAILGATRNDLENNFAYNKDVMDGFSKAFLFAVHALNSITFTSDEIYWDGSLNNLLYLAFKFDKTHEVIREVKAYREIQKRYSTNTNAADIFCEAIDWCNKGNYPKAYEALQTPLSYKYNRDTYSIQATVNIAQYAVLLKCGKRDEALNLLMQQEHFLRENKMTFELLEVLQLIKQHYEVDGNAAMAKEYSLLYFTTKDGFINKSRLGKMDEAKLNIELEQTRENVREMANRQKIQTIVLWATVIIALLLFVILLGLYVNYRKTRRTNRVLYDKNIALLNANEQLKQLSTPEPVSISSPKEPQEQSPDEPSREDIALLDRITAVMETSSEVYNEGFSIVRLAILAGASQKNVSRVINDLRLCNFNALLNEYRIKEACKRLLDTKNYGGLTIESIARSLGFRSRANFVNVFKDATGLTPSAFQKMSREIKQ
ncbi:MAG: helix-turn-helix transcriptional regulator [Bacteroidales bacterium]|nr:helix-turn-helix transcriptional regulator [Candidatus Sodaliphilus aphodohippi]